MADSILSSLLSQPKSSFSFMSGTPLLRGVKIKRIIGHFASTLPRHMLEDGSTVSDIRILQPLTLAVEVICPTIDDAEDVINFMNDRASLYRVTSKGLVFENLMAQSISVKQSAAMLTAAPFRIYLKQYLLENASPVTVAQAPDSNLIDRGVQLLNSTTQTVTGLFTSVTKSAANAINSLTGG